MTLDRLAASTQQEFLRLDRKIDVVLDAVKRVKEDVGEEVRKENVKVIESNDKVVTRLDRLLKEDAAHTERHRRIDDRLDSHEERIKRIERVRG